MVICKKVEAELLVVLNGVCAGLCSLPVALSTKHTGTPFDTPPRFNGLTHSQPTFIRARAVQENEQRMQSPSESSEDDETPQKTLPIRFLSKTVVVSSKQPTFDEELVVPAAKKRKTSVVKTSSRLKIASKNSFYGVLESVESEDCHVKVYPLNYGLRFRCADVEMVNCVAYRNGFEAENLDVCEEKGGHFDPGKAELAGFAVLAYEIAEDLIETNHVAIIASFSGGDAVKLLCEMVATAVRRIAGSARAAQIIGRRQAPKPKSKELQNICQKFSKMSKTVARVELAECV